MFFKAEVAPVLFSLFSCPVFSLQSVWVVRPLLCIYGEKPRKGCLLDFQACLTVELGRWMKDTCLILDDLMNSPVLVERGVGLFLLLHRLR